MSRLHCRFPLKTLDIDVNAMNRVHIHSLCKIYVSPLMLHVDTGPNVDANARCNRPTFAAQM